MGIFNEQSFDHPFAKGIPGAPGVGFSLTADGSYDMNKKKLTNVGAPSNNTDAATKKYVDDNSSGSPKTSGLTVDSNIDMKDRYRITNLSTPLDAKEPPTKEYVDNTFLDRDGSYPMKGDLNMDNNKMVKVGAPTANDDAANKSYVDTKVTNTMSSAATKQELANYLKKDGTDSMKGSLDMANNRIFNLPTPTGPKQPTPLAFTDLKYLHVSGTNKMTNNLNMDNKKIINLRPPTSDTDAATKKYVDDNTGAPDLSDYLEKDGTVAMTGNLNLNSHEIDNLSDPSTDKQAANRGWVRKQIERLDHHSGEASSGVFTITDPARPTTMYLQYISGGSASPQSPPTVDFVLTTSAPGQALASFAPTANTYVNKIEFQFGSRNVNVDFLFFIPRDNNHSNSVFWVSGNRTGTWSLNIHKSWNYNMSGVKLRTHNNNNHSAITCRVFFDLPKAITKPLGRIEINTPKIVISGVVKADVNLGGNKIKNLGVPTQDNESVNKGYVDNLVHHTAVQPSHYKDEFSYLMLSGAQWTDETDGGNSFVISKIGDLAPNKGNFHDYNHKVIYASIRKRYDGNTHKNTFNYKMGINFYRLTANTEYTLCLEILNTDYNLWNNTQISVDKGTSTGLSIGNTIVKKLSHRYTDSTGSTKTMYYHRIIVNFRKLSSGNKFFLHISVDFLQGGYNISTYPSLFSGVYIIAYGIVGTFSNIDPDKVYDYHTAFDIKPTEVVYNVDINANQKEITNIKLDRQNNNSAATVALVKEVAPFTKNALYRLYFSEVYDFTHADSYGINIGSSGVIINSVKPNITLPPNKDLDEIEKDGLHVNGYDVTFSPTHSSKSTLCIVFTHWRNRSFTLTKYLSTNNNILVKLNYDKTNNKVTLTINRATQNFTMLSEFSGKIIVLWLTENFDSNVTKVKISKYSGTLTIPAVFYNVNQRWKFTTEDGVLNKLMYSPNFYDDDSEQYHKVMLQEKLNGSYIV